MTGSRYGRMDRFLHRVAFRLDRTQVRLADVESEIFRDRLAGIPVDSPVFISALPRSGTTILLRLLWRTGRFATHLYRDMPFVLCPMLWERFSGSFIVDDVSRERDHGDGIEVSADSPEAFEEMVWKQFWPGHYRSDRIVPWTASEENSAFESFLESNMRKIIALRRRNASDHRRYLSKNNVNIARLAASPGPLRRGTILVLFREPVQHAASMLRQHRRFTQLHAEDRFLRRYMEAVGHHEFGAEFKPIDFGGWLDGRVDSDKLGFWLRYWTAAYRFVLEHAGPTCRTLSYRALHQEPESTLRAVAQLVEVPEAELVAQSDRLRAPRTHSVNTDELSDALVEEASTVHERLQQSSDLA